jgi:short subunit dehydrogenase-like uncharacterized protein
MQTWMIYGANGYTGELIARDAARRGHRPLLAGRNAAAVARLASELQLESRIFDVDDAAQHLRELELVLHCAGPFMHTSRPMVDACLAMGTSYLDITGEIAVFEAIMRRGDEARQRGVTLVPGVGFDVVPSDCLAALLAERLPDATELTLAFYNRGGSISRGTMKTMIEGAGEGGAIRRDGKITPVPVLFDVREIPFDIGSRLAATIPWGDVSTAFYTTGIPNIRVYFGMSRRAVRKLGFIKPLLPLTRWKPLHSLLLRYAGRRTGPDAVARERARVHLYGRAANRAGRSVSATMTTPDGYSFTILSALAAVERFLTQKPSAGAFTPTLLFGSSFALSLPGVEFKANPNAMDGVSSTTAD